MTNLRNAIITGLAALLMGCATGQSARTQDSPLASSTRYDSVNSRFDRLSELETSYGGATASMSGYVMGTITDVSLRVVAGVYVGTVKVIPDGENGFSAKGTYWQAAHPEAIEKAYKEADVDGDKIITRKEAEELTMKVFQEYVAPESFPKVEEGIDAERNLYKKVHDKL